MLDSLVQDSMQIILHAGDARVYVMKCLDSLSKFDIEEAKKNYKLADEKIVLAHRVQTNAIQCEMNGEKLEYSMLFAHAQDTLMTICSEINVAKKMILLIESIDARFKNLEK